MRHRFQTGYAAIMTTIMMLTVSLTVITAFTAFALQEVRTNRAYVHSVDAHAIAESGIEDAAWRILAGKAIGASQTLGVGGGATTISVTTAGNTRTIRSEGVENSFQNNMETVIDINNDSVSFYYGVQVGDSGLSMGNNAVVNGNIYSNGSIIGASGATITGDATVAGGIDDGPQEQWPVNNADQVFAVLSSNRDIAQSFKATETGLLPKVSVLIAKVGTPSDIVLRITEDNSDKPKITTLASATIKASSVGASPSWIDVAFATQPFVTNNTKYWIVLDYGSSGANHWIWRKDSGDTYGTTCPGDPCTGKYTSDWSSPSASWTSVGGDLASKIWIGGTNTKIEKVTIGNASSGTGRANLFVNDTIHGSACPNAYCIVENPPRVELPISDGVIQDWRDDAAAGGTCAAPDCGGIANFSCNASGDCEVAANKTATLGPKKITGKLTVSNGATLIAKGTLWAVGDIVFDENAVVSLDPGYGERSGIIMSDAKINVKNGAALSGSGNPKSYLMVLSAKNSIGEELITVDNASQGAIYYAGKGRIKVSNNATAKEVTAYGITLDNNATITYESGLADASFSSGPSGGYVIRQWREVP